MKKEEIKTGVTVIDADTLLVKDEYCTFYLHRYAPEVMTWDDAMQWAKDKGWSLPDRWQGLTITRYRDEIVKHFGRPPYWWFWTCEEYAFSRVGAWYVSMYGGNVDSYFKGYASSALAVSAFHFYY